MRDNEPMYKQINNHETIGGYFSYLFLRGNEILLKQTLSFRLIRHLMICYDGRFENSKFFINLLYNQ